MVTRRTMLGLGAAAAGGLALGGGIAAKSYTSALDRARARTAPELSELITTQFGDLEYVVEGAGPPILVLHGTGGGFDQGLFFSQRLLEMGYKVIAPSRFGYLRSEAPENATIAMQADAYVELLDELGIDKVAVIGGSAGARSALEFAIRHPDRCAALFPIVPQTYYPEIASLEPWSPWQQNLVLSILGSDFLFWAAASLLPAQVQGALLATDPALIATATKQEQQRVDEFLWNILPMSERADGLLVDTKHALAPYDMQWDRISAPTLTISMEDDHYATAHSARHIATQVSGARLLLFPTGGHMWVGRDAEIFTAIDAQLREIGFS